VSAGDHFLQFRIEKTRCGVPCHDYQVSAKPVVTQVVSEVAVTLEETPSKSHSKRMYVVEDATAGPVTLSEIAAIAENDRELTVSGVVRHSGGTGQLQGGKVEIRVEALTATGGSRGRGVVVAHGTETFWLRTNQPKTVTLSSMSIGEKTDAFGKVERIRVFLTYQSCR
jgi:hypothetical protein